ncbi:RinA family protein [Lactococcus cremoris]|uniref:RinA family protein n=1 Tax=Lactococcus lactis subsp. cremoris TaxID=1359 RepID=UPI0021FA5B51|nr:RinA family protein [Lactococcus cremoris]UXV60934.1 RinA family protein [Lactococcus cremoris]
MKDKIDKIISDYINGRTQAKIKAIESRYIYRVKQDNLGIRIAYKGTAEPEGNTLNKERMEEDKELIELRRTLELLGALYNTLTVLEKRVIELRYKGYNGFTWYRVDMELESAGIEIPIKRAKKIYIAFKEDVARVL